MNELMWNHLFTSFSFCFCMLQLHQLMPSVVTCLVAKRLGTRLADNHWELRDFTAHLVASICKRWDILYLFCYMFCINGNKQLSLNTFIGMVSYLFVGCCNLFYVSFDFVVAMPNNTKFIVYFLSNSPLFLEIQFKGTLKCFYLVNLYD